MATNPGALSEQTFFDAHTDTLRELFSALGRADEWRDSPEELLPYTQSKWVGEDHGNSGEKDQFTPEQELAAMEIMDDLGLRREAMPAPGSYEQVVIVGGLMRVNRERMLFTERLIETGVVETDRVVFWAGQRLRDPRDDQQVNMVNLAGLAGNGWIRRELAKPNGQGWENGFATETELARLAFLERFPKAELVDVDSSLQTSVAGGVPDRAAASYTFANEDFPDFVLMNCAAVERAQGPPRHTTTSCAAEWLQTFSPEPATNVLVVSGNPHILRSGHDIRGSLTDSGLADVELGVCGPAASPNASLQLYLGEIGRLLYIDAAQSEISTSAER